MIQIIPVMRVFDYSKTIEFYIDWLGFQLEWEHKPEGTPFYMRVSMKDVSIDLSEHHGECSPGAKISVNGFDGLESYHKVLTEKAYKFMKPGLGKIKWNHDMLEMTVIDPFYNHIIFNEALKAK
jgi:hypothetical protein